MENFYYIIRFFCSDEIYHLHINLEYYNYITHVFYRTFSSDEKELKKIYMQIADYFNKTHIKMTKSEAMLLYNVFKRDDLVLPNPQSFTEINTSYRITKGITPKEILFLIYINNKSVKRKVAKYWEEDYYLDTEYTIKHLLYLNYLTTDDFRANLEKATKKEISIILEKHNLPISGRKSELVNLVKKKIPINIQKEYFSGLYYKQTLKGEQIAIYHQKLNDFHKSYYRYAYKLRIEEFFLLNKRYKDLEAKDVCKMMVENISEDNKNNFTWDFLDSDNKQDSNDFTSIINKNNVENNANDNKVSDELFLSIINKDNKDVKVDEKKEDIFFQIINKKYDVICEETINNKQISEEGEKEVEFTSDIKNESPNIIFYFIRSLVYSSIFVIIIIFFIFEYVIK